MWKKVKIAHQVLNNFLVFFISNFSFSSSMIHKNASRSHIWLMFLTLHHTNLGVLTILVQRASENIVGKGENVDNEYFLIFPQCFNFYQRQKSTL